PGRYVASSATSSSKSWALAETVVLDGAGAVRLLQSVSAVTGTHARRSSTLPTMTFWNAVADVLLTVKDDVSHSVDVAAVPQMNDVLGPSSPRTLRSTSGTPM